MRVKSIYDFDPDYRGNARGEVWCVLCQKALRPNTKYRFLHLINGGVDVLHPDDEALYVSDGGDLGAQEKAAILRDIAEASTLEELREIVQWMAERLEFGKQASFGASG